MLSLTKPDNAVVNRLLTHQAGQAVSYPHQGQVGLELPAGFDHDRVCIDLGEGCEVFERAKSALRHWRQFQVGWAEAVPIDTPLQAGQTFAIRARMFGIWAVAFGRINKVIDEAGPPHRFGFSFGTLPDHPEQGEEQFMVQMDANDRVTYEARAFFRPHMVVAKMVWPYFRYRFNKFRRESAAAMAREIKS